MSNQRHRNTIAVHGAKPYETFLGEATLPIFRSTVFRTDTGTPYHKIRYPRLSNLPNHELLHDKIAGLEQTESALVTASGMAAISSALLSVLQMGDHVLVHEQLYGGTHTFIAHELSRFGIQHDFVDATNPASWSAALRKETKAFYVESITNPLLRVAAHHDVVSFSKQHGLTTLIDNTVSSPINFRPATLGYDIVLHSATKYLNGHSDVVAGAIAGSKSWVQSIKRRLDHLGGSLDPGACYLLDRGLKTLHLRVPLQCASAATLAARLDELAGVQKVHHPSLASHPDYQRARALMGGASGLVGFETTRTASDVLADLQLIVTGPSLGGVESNATCPAATSHVGMTPEERAASGIHDNLIRLSVGVENIEDLWQDLQRAITGKV